MSALLGLAGAILLALAAVPQALKLARDRRAADFDYGFVALNVVGLGLFAIRSAEVKEWSFLAVNLLLALFWLAVFATKALAGGTVKPRRELVPE